MAFRLKLARLDDELLDSADRPFLSTICELSSSLLQLSSVAIACQTSADPRIVLPGPPTTRVEKM